MKFSRSLSMLAAAGLLSLNSVQALAKSNRQLVCKFVNQFNGKAEYAMAIDAHSKGSKSYLNLDGDLDEETGEFFVSQSPQLLEDYCEYTIKAHWKGAHTAFRFAGMKVYGGEKSPLYTINSERSAVYPAFLTAGWVSSLAEPEKVPDARPDSKENAKKNWVIRGGVGSALVIAGALYFKRFVYDPAYAKEQKHNEENIQPKAPEKFTAPSRYDVIGWLKLAAKAPQAFLKDGKEILAFLGLASWGTDQVLLKAGAYYDWKVDLASKYEEDQMPDATTRA